MPNVYLIGMPGCGKTTLAQGAALELNRPFLDLDKVVEQTWGSRSPRFLLPRGRMAFGKKKAPLYKRRRKKTVIWWLLVAVSFYVLKIVISCGKLDG